MCSRFCVIHVCFESIAADSMMRVRLPLVELLDGMTASSNMLFWWCFFENMLLWISWVIVTLWPLVSVSYCKWPNDRSNNHFFWQKKFFFRNADGLIVWHRLYYRSSISRKHLETRHMDFQNEIVTKYITKYISHGCNRNNT